MIPDQNKLFVFLSPEIEALLIENHTEELLKRDGLNISRAFERDPTREEGSAQKGDPVSIILATAGFGISPNAYDL